MSGWIPDPETLNVADRLTAIPFPIGAHRGDINPDDGYPENTVEAFRQAARRGAHVIEIDCLQSSEGTWFCMHDTTVNRTTDGTGNLSSLNDAAVAALNIDGGFGYDSERHGTSLDVPTVEAAIEACLPFDPVFWLDCNVLTEAGHRSLAMLVVELGIQSRTIIEASSTTFAEVVKRVDSSITTTIHPPSEASDVNIDRVYDSYDDLSDDTTATGLEPKPLDAYIDAATYINTDETPILSDLWDWGVRLVLTNQLPTALTARQERLGAAGGDSALDDLSDVTITTPADGEVLRYDGSGWVNEELSGVGLVTVDPGTVAYDDSGPDLEISITAKWGHDGTDPYFNDAGVVSGEEAALLFDPVTRDWKVVPYEEA